MGTLLGAVAGATIVIILFIVGDYVRERMGVDFFDPKAPFFLFGPAAVIVIILVIVMYLLG